MFSLPFLSQSKRIESKANNNSFSQNLVSLVLSFFPVNVFFSFPPWNKHRNFSLNPWPFQVTLLFLTPFILLPTFCRKQASFSSRPLAPCICTWLLFLNLILDLLIPNWTLLSHLLSFFKLFCLGYLAQHHLDSTHISIDLSVSDFIITSFFVIEIWVCFKLLPPICFCCFLSALFLLSIAVLSHGSTFIFIPITPTSLPQYHSFLSSSCSIFLSGL